MEKFILNCMEAIFSTSFPEKETIYKQYKNSGHKVDFEAQGYISVKFTPEWTQLRVTNNVRVPVSALAEQKDGTHIMILIHILDGLLSELEVYSLENTPLLYEEEFFNLKFDIEDGRSYPRRFFVN